VNFGQILDHLCVKYTEGFITGRLQHKMHKMLRDLFILSWNCISNAKKTLTHQLSGENFYRLKEPNNYSLKYFSTNTGILATV